MHPASTVRRAATAALALLAILAVAAAVLGLGSASASTERQPAGEKSARAGLPAVTAGQLRPAPRVAAADVPEVVPDGCLARRDVTAARACLYADISATTRVLVLGDSHVAQWFPAIRAAATAEDWRLSWLTKVGCPAQDVSVRFRGGTGPYRECTQWRRSAFALVKRWQDQGPFDLVILGGSYGSTVLDRATGAVLTGVDRAAEWKAGLERTLAVVAPRAKRVVVLRDTPRQRVDVPACIQAKRATWQVACSTPRAWAYPLPLFAADLAGTETVATATVLDLTQPLCGPQACTPNAGRLLRWRNATELTATYAASLTSLVRKALATAMSPPPSPTPTPTASPTPTATPTLTATATSTPSPSPSGTGSPSPSSSSTASPSASASGGL